MSEKVKVACVQFACGAAASSDEEQVKRNIETADRLTRGAAGNGAKIILLSELFERFYFCQERRYDYYELALPLTDNPAIAHFRVASAVRAFDIVVTVIVNLDRFAALIAAL